MNNNYRLIEKRELPDLKSAGFWYEHSKTGAQIVHLQNAEVDKCFCITFKTPPGDDTGLPHIMEHSVLSGSEKFPVKDPFMELAKGSLVSFLNAMTWSDMTQYPVASYNHKEFLNLMNVYLDSVFFPLIYERKQSFLQEGWHYDLKSADDALSINGIVYSEMKGAFSDPLTYVSEKAFSELFPDNCYRFESGGYPDAIPDLTYENYLQFHRDYYHPSNSIVYFYGDMDIEPCLSLLDEYLSRFDKKTVDGSVKRQSPFEQPKMIGMNYPVLEGGDGDGKNILVASYVMGDMSDTEKSACLSLVTQMLINMDSSPLRKALLDAGMGEDIQSQYNDSVIQPTFDIMVINSRYDGVKLRQIIENTLNDIVNNGIDKNLAEACLNHQEFFWREADFRNPKGLTYNMEMLQCLRHGGNPLDMYSRLSAIEKLRAGLNDGYIERLIKEHILGNNHAVYMTASPKTGINEAKEKALAEKLAAYKAGLSENEINAIIEESKNLLDFQNRVDSSDDLAKIPHVEISDISKDCEKIPIEIKNIEGVPALYSALDTNGIAYVSFVFDIDVVPAERLSDIGLLYNMLKKLDTKHRGYTELANDIGALFGGFEFDFARDVANDGSYKAYVKLDVKALRKNAAQIFEFADEIINDTLFDDRKRVKELLAEIKSGMERLINYRGDSFAEVRAASYIFGYERVYDSIKGLGFYQYVCEMLDNFDSRFDELKNNLADTARVLFDKSGLTFTMCCDGEIYKDTAANASAFVKSLRDNTPSEQTSPGTYKAHNEAFITSSMVQYNAAAYDFRNSGYKYSGAMEIFCKIVSNDYLMNELRAKGGAYGFSAAAYQSGDIHMSSYRDPNLANTYKVYAKAPEYIESLSLGGDEMKKYITGTVNVKDKPLSNYKKHLKAVRRYFSKRTDADEQRERDEILGCTAENIKDCAETLRLAQSTEKRCTIGSEDKINESKEIFGNIVRLPL